MKKDVNEVKEELTEVQAESVTINEENKKEENIEVDEGSEDVVKKPKKERSNGFKALMMLLCTVVILAGIMIATGGWNPFKSRKAEEVAVEKYENSLEESRDLWVDMGCEEYNPELGDDQAVPRDYAPDGENPYGFEILEDNGKDGKLGVLKAMSTAAGEYSSKYGLNFDIYYMKNNDYANEKYIQVKNSASATGIVKKEYTIKNGKVTVAADYPIGMIYFFIKDGTTVYSTHGLMERYSTMQAFFDALKIDFKIPQLEEVK